MKLALMAALLLMLTTSAFAEPPRRGDGWRGNGQHHHGPRVDPNAAIVGGIIGGWLWRQFNEPPAPPPVVIQERQALAPWTPEWYSYCTGRYRSFSPSTGYYMGYDGNPHFCR